jgi:hypothetical protein
MFPASQPLLSFPLASKSSIDYTYKSPCKSKISGMAYPGELDEKMTKRKLLLNIELR